MHQILDYDIHTKASSIDEYGCGDMLTLEEFIQPTY